METTSNGSPTSSYRQATTPIVDSMALSRPLHLRRRKLEINELHVPLEQLAAIQRELDTPRAYLRELPATAICGNDILSSVLYSASSVAAKAGKLMPVHVFFVSIVLFAFQFIYEEVVTAIPLNGGTYNALLNTTSKRPAAVAACLSILSYVATAVASTTTGVRYLNNQVTVPIVGCTILLLGAFSLLTATGMSYSSRVALSYRRSKDNQEPPLEFELRSVNNSNASEFSPSLGPTLRAFTLPEISLIHSSAVEMAEFTTNVGGDNCGVAGGNGAGMDDILSSFAAVEEMRQAKLTLEEMEEKGQWVDEGSDVESLAKEDEPLESAGATALFTGLTEEALAEPFTSKYNTLVAKPCGCRQNCNESFGTDEFLPVARRLSYDVSLMSRKEKKLVLAFFFSTQLAPGKNSNVKYRVPWLGSVCRSFFLDFWSSDVEGGHIGSDTIRGLREHLRATSPMLPKAHGLTGRSNKALASETKDAVVNFLTEMSRNYGKSIATRQYKRKKTGDGSIKVTWEKADLILLPSCFSQQNRYKNFLLVKGEGNNLSRNSFVRIWKADPKLEKLRIRSPSSDICDECFIFKKTMANVMTISEIELLGDGQAEHVRSYKELRDLYESYREIAKNSGDRDVLAFDYSQIVSIPQNPEQPCQWYCLSLPNLYHFGVVNEGHGKQYNFVYPESKGGKVSNEVASLVCYALRRIPLGSRKLVLWADNCTGQNKNRAMLQLFRLLVN
ncbi:hypothetical protein PsorP6_007495 [Peronosclerospora sorghi]|uniref:Uncharacterized protein n=1 Tax=Peronosclerospora sorghi TaxID=230839 RepID=A0ACC0W988_9STRA|nr:hypothetical protein PsorP6_007495 [Peronosclerospora sorghi]